MKRFSILSTLFTIFLPACFGATPPPNEPQFNTAHFNPEITNGLTPQDRINFYHLDEGIQYLPTSVFLSLDQPHETGLGLYERLFFEHPERLGLYPDPYGSELPIGITASTDISYLKMTALSCATCHTSLISYKGQSFLVDGGSSLFAIDRFIKEIMFSIAGTLAEPTEFIKFYNRYRQRETAQHPDNDADLQTLIKSDQYNEVKRILKDPNYSEPGLNTFHLHLQKHSKYAAIPGTEPKSSDLDTGFKMFGYLFKRFMYFYGQTKYAATPNGQVSTSSGLGRSNPWSVTKNMMAAHFKNKPSDEWSKEQGGPVRTPTIFDYERKKWIFLSDSTNSVLQRNFAQSVALMADFDWDTYATTTKIKKIEALSVYTRKINAPLWNENIFGPLNQNKIKNGEGLFNKYCISCHDPKSAIQDRGTVEYNRYDAGTDGAYYEGQVSGFYTSAPNDFFTDGLTPFLNKAIKIAVQREGIKNLSLYQVGREPAIWKTPIGNLFEAKPLYGIAFKGTGFLHNGSIISIRELLMPSSKRSKTVVMGSVEFDPVNLGYTQDSVWYGSSFQVECESGCRGNSNRGHEGKQFGTDLSDTDKDNLIEFMKSYHK